MMNDKEALPTAPAVCVYADEAGQSHLIDVGLPALTQVKDDNGNTRFLGASGATTMGFVVGGEANDDWHASGMVGLSIVLRGAWDIEAGSGQRRVLGTGSVLLMFDTHGRGHRAHPSGDEGCSVLGVGIDEATKAAYWDIVQKAIAAGAGQVV